ncbi:MAG: UDP-glucose 4-epimerase GalE [Armatimonadota bacterium]|nr:UDP-glucose 4-epimerase GalE [Armatimonadota bacterium]
MAILVTGGLGYVGSHAVKLLMDSGREVISYDNLLFGHKEASSGSTIVVGDLLDLDKLRDTFDRHPIDSVMHFAALADVGDSVTNPHQYYSVNVTGSLNLAKAMVEHNIKNLIFSSSAAVFGEPEVVPIPEGHPKNPTNPYGRSKLMFEEILAEFEVAYGIKSVSLRYFNASGADPSGLIGEDHTPEHHLIPIVLQVALAQREQVTIFGGDWDTPDGSCIRDYVHVTDLAQAHLRALESLENGGPSAVYNMGNGSGYSVKEVIRLSEEITGKPIKSVVGPRRAGDPARLVASSDRIKKELGWEPKYPELRTIIKTAWDWHSSHPNGYSVR